MEDEFERITDKLEEVKGKISNPENVTPQNTTEQDYFRKYEEILEDIDDYQERFMREELSAGD